MMSYRDIASKNVFGFIPIERKIEEEVKEKYEIITCHYCGAGIDYLEDDYCEYEENIILVYHFLIII